MTADELVAALREVVFRASEDALNGFTGEVASPANIVAAVKDDPERVLTEAAGRWLAGIAKADQKATWQAGNDMAIAALARVAHVPATGLDAGWREAEAALPEGWRLSGLTPGGPVGNWRAEAYGRTVLSRDPVGLHPEMAHGDGPTPAAALLALAAALREKAPR